MIRPGEVAIWSEHGEIIVTLPHILVELGREVGMRRQRDAERSGRIPGNGLNVAPEQQLNLHIQGALGELVVKQLLDPIKWHDFKTGPLDDTPDLSDFIDVKTLSRFYPASVRNLIAKKGGVKEQWVYVLVVPEEKSWTYRVCGWVWGDALLAAPLKEFQPGRPAHVIAGTVPPLQPIHLLDQMEK